MEFFRFFHGAMETVLGQGAAASELIRLDGSMDYPSLSS
jgi:hypothetical protein